MLSGYDFKFHKLRPYSAVSDTDGMMYNGTFRMVGRCRLTVSIPVADSAYGFIA
jgi:hypothetical protein